MFLWKMVSEVVETPAEVSTTEVLILVLVEDGLRDSMARRLSLKANVLILVLVEDGLRGFI